MLEQFTHQQSQSAKWKESQVGRVTTSQFGDALLRKSPPTELFIDMFFDTSQYSTVPAPINHGLQNEVKALLFKDRLCGICMWAGYKPIHSMAWCIIRWLS